MAETTQQTVDATEKPKKGPKVSVSPTDMDLMLAKMRALNSKEFKQSNREMGKTAPEAAATEWKAYTAHGEQEWGAIKASRSAAARAMGTESTGGAVLKAGAIVGVGAGLGYLLYRQYSADHPDDETGEL